MLPGTKWVQEIILIAVWKRTILFVLPSLYISKLLAVDMWNMIEAFSFLAKKKKRNLKLKCRTTEVDSISENISTESDFL